MKYQEIQDQKHEILRKYFIKKMKYFGIFTRLSFDLSYMKCQKENTMKYQELLCQKQQKHEISGNT
jgi:hypothetical protein